MPHRPCKPLRRDDFSQHRKRLIGVTKSTSFAPATI